MLFADCNQRFGRCLVFVGWRVVWCWLLVVRCVSSVVCCMVRVGGCVLRVLLCRVLFDECCRLVFVSVG